MRIDKSRISDHNDKNLDQHQVQLDFLEQQLARKEVDVESIIQKLSHLQIAIPSWALGSGGTRFGRFSIGGEPGNLEEKIADVGIIHSLTKSAGSISLHIPWDIPENSKSILEFASSYDIAFDAVNSNTFQDQPGQSFSYKFGSLSNTDKNIRQQAIEHNIEVIEYGKALGSKAITIWLSDGTSFPGQANFNASLKNTCESFQEIYLHLPGDWKMFIEYKPFEPNFYSMVVPDWGTSLLLAQGCGDKAFCLVDLGHHLPGTNIEQIVSTLLMHNRLGGFHFNDSKYGDDDLTAGSIKPYQLFLIFIELVHGMDQGLKDISWMIDASHNIKDPLEDLIQSIEAILLAYGQAMLIDLKELESHQLDHDVIRCQEVLQDAFRTDIRPLIREARLRADGALFPVDLYRELQVRITLTGERGSNTTATGL